MVISVSETRQGGHQIFQMDSYNTSAPGKVLWLPRIGYHPQFAKDLCSSVAIVCIRTVWTVVIEHKSDSTRLSPVEQSMYVMISQ